MQAEKRELYSEVQTAFSDTFSHSVALLSYPCSVQFEPMPAHFSTGVSKVTCSVDVYNGVQNLAENEMPTLTKTVQQKQQPQSTLML